MPALALRNISAPSSSPRSNCRVAMPLSPLGQARRTTPTWARVPTLPAISDLKSSPVKWVSKTGAPLFSRSKRQPCMSSWSMYGSPVARSILGTSGAAVPDHIDGSVLGVGRAGQDLRVGGKDFRVGTGGRRRAGIPVQILCSQKRHRWPPLSLRVNGDVIVLAQLVHLVELLLKPRDMAFELVVALAMPLHEVLVEMEVRHVARVVALLAEIGEAGDGRLLGCEGVVQNLGDAVMRGGGLRLVSWARPRGTAAG